MSKGVGLFFAEVPARPTSLKSFGKHLLQNFHDRPLGVLGVRPNGRWERLIVARPMWVPGAIGAVRISKLEVDVESPTRHDAEVLTSISWSGDDATAQERIDRGLDGRLSRSASTSGSLSTMRRSSPPFASSWIPTRPF
jgi:hypothetical protein